MSKPRCPAPKTTPPAPVPDVRRRWTWPALLVLLFVAASALVAYAVFSRDGHDQPPEGMVWIPPGSFLMGSENFDDAQPVHEVELSGFWMDAREVTNEQFAAF